MLRALLGIKFPIRQHLPRGCPALPLPQVAGAVLLFAGITRFTRDINLRFPRVRASALGGLLTGAGARLVLCVRDDRIRVFGQRLSGSVIRIHTGRRYQFTTADWREESLHDAADIEPATPLRLNHPCVCELVVLEFLLMKNQADSLV